MSVTKDAKPYLTPDEAAAAYIAGAPMEYNTKGNRVENGGSGEGWVDINEMVNTFWGNFSIGLFDFRLKAQHAYKRGDVVRVRSVRKGGERKHGAFPFTSKAFFAIVQGPYGPKEEGDFCLIDGDGTSQVTNRDDFEFVDIETE